MAVRCHQLGVCVVIDLIMRAGVLQCARDFVDYDANSLAVAAGVPPTIELANAVLGRMDRGNCTHAGMLTQRTTSDFITLCRAGHVCERDLLRRG